MEFEELRQDYFHHVSCGPHEKKPSRIAYSDILHHLSVLEYYASHCRYIVEFGVRDAFSTVAFLSGLPVGGSLLSIDIEESVTVKILRKMETGKNWEFRLASSLDQNLNIGNPDLIFFDTLHTYEQLDAELKRHMDKSKRYLAFHDTLTCWEKDRTGPNPDAEGIGRAIVENVVSSCNPSYNLEFVTKWSNGLQIYKKYQDSLQLLNNLGFRL